MLGSNWVTGLQLFSEIWALKSRGVIFRFRCEKSDYDLGYMQKPTIATLSVDSKHVRVVLEGRGVTSVTETPHYSFVVGHLSGCDEMKNPWRLYFTTFYGRALLPDKEATFTALIENAETGTKIRPILVRKDPQHAYFVVLDGLHRMATQSVLSPTQAIDCYLTP